MKTKEYVQGQTIFKVGESADGLFIIGSGEVGIYFPENREMQKPNQILKETQIFGEMGTSRNLIMSLVLLCMFSNKSSNRRTL